MEAGPKPPTLVAEAEAEPVVPHSGPKEIVVVVVVVVV